MPLLKHLLLLSLILISGVALAGTPAPNIYELRERERNLDTRRERALRAIEERLQAQTLDPDGAIMERSRINHDYRNEMNQLRAQQDSAYRALEDRRKPARSGAAPSSVLPRIPSQSVVTYPQDGEPAPDETPQSEVRQKNVGFGTREVEF